MLSLNGPTSSLRFTVAHMGMWDEVHVGPLEEYPTGHHSVSHVVYGFVQTGKKIVSMSVNMTTVLPL